jgi:quinohemoprotein ethanol dehydrogenase
MAAPATYEVDGVQYVVVSVGMGGARGKTYPPESAAYRYGNNARLVALRIGGGAVPLPPPAVHAAEDQVPSVPRRGTPIEIAAGGALFQRNCALCHTNNGANGSVPDLRQMSAATHLQFSDIVLKGIRAAKGMGSFGGILKPDEAENIHRYLIDLAWRSYDAKQDHNPVH